MHVDVLKYALVNYGIVFGVAIYHPNFKALKQLELAYTTCYYLGIGLSIILISFNVKIMLNSVNRKMIIRKVWLLFYYYYYYYTTTTTTTTTTTYTNTIFKINIPPSYLYIVWLVERSGWYKLWVFFCDIVSHCFGFIKSRIPLPLTIIIWKQLLLLLLQRNS